MSSDSSPSAPEFSSNRPSVLPTRTMLGFLVAVVAVLLVSMISYQSLQDRSRSAQLVTRTTSVLDAIRELVSLVKDMETGQRGYLLTDREEFLQPFLQARAEMPPQLDELHALLDVDPDQRGKLVILEGLLEQYGALLTEAIDARRADALSRAELSTNAALGKQLMDRIRVLTAEMAALEYGTLRRQQQSWEGAAKLSFVVQLAGTGVLLSLIAAAAVIATRDHRGREDQGWLRSGQMALATRLQGEQRLDVLGDALLELMARFLDAQRGAMYVVEGDMLQRVSAYAGSAAPERVALGEGLLGQAVASRRTLHVDDVPGDYFGVGSATGGAVARELLITPARVDGAVLAVIELGFFRKLSPRDLEYLDLVSDMLGVAVRASRDRSRLERLLEETQRQAEELQTQEEEMRVANEELEEQGRLLRQSQETLEAQQAELEQTNLRLTEQTQELEEQRDGLASAQAALEQRAAELQRANQYKTEFLANMSHELRTPLNSTLILAKLLGDNPQGNLTAEQVRFAQTIGSAGNDLLVLINDILDLSKIEAGKVEVVSAPVDIRTLAESMRATFGPTADSRKLGFTVTVADDVPTELRSDRQRIGQILKNLLSNALKFTERGEVALAIRRGAPGMLEFSVSDTGIGLSAAQTEIIFEAFRQADGSTHRKYGGTGLGLSISRDLARLLGGDITVTSESGAGSVFTLTLPLERGAAAGAASPPTRQAAPATRESAPAPDVRAESTTPKRAATRLPAIEDDRDVPSGKRTILVVEDDPAFAEILRDLARELDFRCVVTQNGADGIAAARQQVPDAIVLDIKLPDHSGLGVLDQLKRDPRTRHIPVHIVSSADYAHEAMELGAVGYALKPVQRDELVQAFRRLEQKFSQQVRQILVVEDDPRQRESMSALLGTGDTRVLAVASATEALALLDDTTFDCVVMDLNLPDLSGYDLLERIAAREDRPYPPVIVYTGRNLSRDEEQTLRRFSRSIILKGVRSPERLLDEVTLFLHQVEANLPADRQRMLKAARDRESTLEGRRVLIVEDDVRNVFALTSVLEPKGVQLEIARNGREALAALQRARGPDEAIDLVLMDIMMPEMDGLTAMREIRSQPEHAALPIIALTAKAMQDDQDQCLAAGANDYIAKPLDVERLLSLVRVWMPK